MTLKPQHMYEKEHYSPMIVRKPDTSTIISIAVFGMLLLAYCLYDVFGLVRHEANGLNLFVVLSFSLMIAALFFKQPLEEKLEPYHKFMKPIICSLLIFISFYLLERPYNQSIVGISAYYTFINLIIIGVLFCVVFFVGQQSKTSAILFLVICFIAGLANYFVISFKGQPVLPADLFALETAAAVGGGYTYAINENTVKAYVMLAFAILLVLFLPKARFEAKTIMANASVSLVGILIFGLWFSGQDLESAYGCEVDVWSAQESYAQQGSLLCFLKRVQDLSPSVPDGYSPEIADEILSSYTGKTSRATYTDSEKPTVIVVMNETFADLSNYQILSQNYEGPQYFLSLADTSLQGNAYVSALSGGTCNSEFEFLTGSSMGSLGGGVYPYVLYDLDSTENIAAYFNALGYETTAIHPAEGVNWRRNIVYEQLGFGEFLDISSFEGAETLRGMPTDKETYKLILDRLNNTDTPQFIFDVTIQNHGGYDTGLIPGEILLETTIDGDSYAEIDEYLSCIQQADIDLQYLIEGLEALDRPVILCFFGDHQPNLADWLSEIEYGKDVADFDLVEVQKRYTVPYMIWKNYDEPYQQNELKSDLKTVDFESGPHSLLSQASSHSRTSDISLNYLSSILLREADLPLTDYQQFLLGIQETMPAINLNGYMDKDGTWYWIGEESDISDVFSAYALVQYDNLFNTSTSIRFLEFAEKASQNTVVALP